MIHLLSLMIPIMFNLGVRLNRLFESNSEGNV